MKDLQKRKVLSVEWVRCIEAILLLRVVHGSIFVTQYNPLQVETFGPNPTQPNTTNNDRFPVPVGSAAKKSSLTAWCNQILSNRALNELTQFFQILVLLL